MKKALLLFLLIVALAGAAFAQPNKPLLMRNPTVSQTQIVFSYAGDLWTVSREGGEASRLTNGVGNEFAPLFSPDGRWIAFTGEYDGNIDVYVIPAAGGTNSLPTKQGGYTKHLDAQTAVLSVDDLPDYRLVSSAEAVRPEGVVPNGWDNVFQKSHTGVLDYRMAEAIVVIYGTTDEAIAAVDVLGQGEESQGAKASPALVGSQSTTWVEPLEIPGYEIVRVVFRADNVVAQIAILGKDSPLLSDDVKLLASTQQTRLARLLQGNA